MSETKVAVVGGGLVGTLQALFLAQRGLDVQLYESRDDIRESTDAGRGRSINLALSHRGRQALKAVGCETEVLASAIPMHSRMIHLLNGKLSPQPYGTKGEAILSVDRQKLNEFLLNKVEEHPNVTLNFRHKLTRADLAEQKLFFATGKNGAEEATARVDFTFGCDGVFSTVRRQLMRWGMLNYRQEYIEHGYKELTMPPTDSDRHAMAKNFLHIWPRHEFMMIALPNQDGSFTVTLFMPFKNFNAIETEEDLLAFFVKHFPDSIDKIGPELLVREFFSNPTGSLVSVKCSPHYLDSRTLIMGDAAHAVVPFYGQGMNAGMEDCLVFDELVTDVGGSLEDAAREYSRTHWRDTHAIADLSMNNYVEMRSHVTSRWFIFRKHLDNLLHWLFPRTFVPLYTMVAFTRIPYHQVVERHERQRHAVDRGLVVVGLSAAIFAVLLGARCLYRALPYRLVLAIRVLSYLD